MRLAKAIAGGVALGVSACALTPDYARPPLDVPPAYEQAETDGASLANLPWWDLFQDPLLRTYLEIALESNLDLRIALARIEEAREQVTVVRAEQFPFLDAGGTIEKGEPIPDAGKIEQASALAALSFEVDLWRKLARATEAARADLLATEAAHRNVTISLVAAVASTYLVLRDFDAELAIARRTVETRRDSLEIIRARFEKGTVPELDVNQAEVELATAEVAALQFERATVQTANALQVLLGRNPGPVERGLPLDGQLALPEVPAGLPVELLERRPDVVAAEQVLAAETARIGVAEALRYPSLELLGTVGWATDHLVTGGDTVWNLAAQLFAPLWNSGQLAAQADAQRARTEQALWGYANTLLLALQETEDALVAVRTLRAEYEARQRQVIAARNAARLSRARYDGGVVDYLEVLESERTLFSAELEESASQARALVAVVQLYKSLGGGWNPVP